MKYWSIGFGEYPVDCPTQLICISDIYMLYICQHTNTKDIAGQSSREYPPLEMVNLAGQVDKQIDQGGGI